MKYSMNARIIIQIIKTFETILRFLTAGGSFYYFIIVIRLERLLNIKLSLTLADSSATYSIYPFNYSISSS